MRLALASTRWRWSPQHRLKCSMRNRGNAQFQELAKWLMSKLQWHKDKKTDDFRQLLKMASKILWNFYCCGIFFIEEIKYFLKKIKFWNHVPDCEASIPRWWCHFIRSQIAPYNRRHKPTVTKLKMLLTNKHWLR